MSFLFPLFLLALLSVVIPVIIHLYNWRKYKQVKFPDISFLESLVVETKKYAKIKNWKLLLLRIALLTTLVLAFAQPYFPQQESQASKVNIYIDNSWSMSYAKGQKNLLQQSKEQALDLIKQLPQSQSVQIVANNNRSGFITKTEAEKWVHSLDFSFRQPNILNLLDNLCQQDKSVRTDIYAFSDFQKHTIVPDSFSKSIDNQNANIYLAALPGNAAANIYIDTAYFLNPAIDIQQSNPLVVKIGSTEGKIATQLQVIQQGKPTSFLSINTTENSFTDTIDLMLNSDEWQRISIAVNDHPMSFDDTFRISLHNQTAQEIAVFNNGNQNNYLGTALASFQKYTIHNFPIQQLHSADVQHTKLVILQGVSGLDQNSLNTLKQWWSMGKHILLIPNAYLNTQQFNAVMQPLYQIELNGWDTSKQTVYSISYNHPLFGNVFEKISENVTLPITHKRLLLHAGLKTSPQYLMSFRDGLPFISTHKIDNGHLTIFTAPLDISINNFPTSAYFAPLLYNIAQSSSGQDFYTFTIDQTANITLPNTGQTTWKFDGQDGVTITPVQHPVGNFIKIALDNNIEALGYYTFYNDQNKEAVIAAFNSGKQESVLTFEDPSQLKSYFSNPENVKAISNLANVYSSSKEAAFPIWRVLLLTALVLLGIETYMALRNRH